MTWHCQVIVVLIGASTRKTTMLQDISERTKRRVCGICSAKVRRTFLFNICTFHVTSSQVLSPLFTSAVFISVSKRKKEVGVDDNERDCIPVVHN